MTFRSGATSLAAGGVGLVCALLLACSTPQAVGKFADKSRTVLDDSTTVFADIPLTCRRRIAIEQTSQPNWEGKEGTAGTPVLPAPCETLDTQSKGLISAAGILKKYFDAVYAVAVFGTSKSTGSVKSKPGLPAQTFTRLGAADDLANLLGRAAIDGYQRKQLRKLLSEADGSVTALADALQTAVDTQYEQLLSAEGSALNDHYFTMGRTEAKNNSTLLFLLDRTYRHDSDDLAHRRTAATALSAALAQIREGHHSLVTARGHLDTSEVAATLTPYSDKLEDLVPKIRKSF